MFYILFPLILTIVIIFLAILHMWETSQENAEQPLAYHLYFATSMVMVSLAGIIIVWGVSTMMYMSTIELLIELQ